MGARLRRRVVLAGTVQGVGFRPWAVRQARELGLDGWAANERDRLIIEIEGEVAPLDAFVKRLQRMPPALARVELIEIAEIAADGSRGFDVAPSTAGAGPALAVPVDVATCAACVQEMRDPLAPLSLPVHQLLKLRPDRHRPPGEVEDRRAHRRSVPERVADIARRGRHRRCGPGGPRPPPGPAERRRHQHRSGPDRSSHVLTRVRA